jgi:hypothetical protein
VVRANAVPKNRSINASVTPGVAFDPSSPWVSPILPSHKSNCHQLVGTAVFDTAPDPAAVLPRVHMRWCDIQTDASLAWGATPHSNSSSPACSVSLREG